jgi:serine/threonine protein phosphatase PrpC
MSKAFFDHAAYRTDTATALREAFLQVNTEIIEANRRDSNFDCELSGTTATVVVVIGNTATFAYVGDSRGFIGRKAGACLVPKFITQDHKPNRPEEIKRITEMGGEVRKLADDFPYRLFVKGQPFPGIAVSRALGDSLAQSVGLSPEPQIEEVKIGETDAYLCIASDGVWEFCSEQEVLNVLSSGASLNRAAELVANMAWERWIENEGDMVDDITAIVLKLNS